MLSEQNQLRSVSKIWTTDLFIFVAEIGDLQLEKTNPQYVNTDNLKPYDTGGCENDLWRKTTVRSMIGATPEMERGEGWKCCLMRRSSRTSVSTVTEWGAAAIGGRPRHKRLPIQTRGMERAGPAQKKQDNAEMLEKKW